MSDDTTLPPYELCLDYFTLGGDRSPGKCDIRGQGREWEWAELIGWGLDGASLILRRRVLVEFEVDVTITTQADYDLFATFYKKWLQNPVYGTKTKSRGIGIYHPRLAFLGIGSVVVKRVGEWKQGRTGGETITIFFKEYRTPKFILSKPNGTIPGVAKPQPAPKDELDIAIEQETAKNKTLTTADNLLGGLL